eukprot:364810-Chlamydomonas_euryale.AAC.11
MPPPPPQDAAGELPCEGGCTLRCTALDLVPPCSSEARHTCDVVAVKARRLKLLDGGVELLADRDEIFQFLADQAVSAKLLAHLSVDRGLCEVGRCGGGARLWPCRGQTGRLWEAMYEQTEGLGWDGCSAGSGLHRRKGRVWVAAMMSGAPRVGIAYGAPGTVHARTRAPERNACRT